MSRYESCEKQKVRYVFASTPMQTKTSMFSSHQSCTMIG